MEPCEHSTHSSRFKLFKGKQNRITRKTGVPEYLSEALSYSVERYSFGNSAGSSVKKILHCSWQSDEAEYALTKG